MSDVAAFLLARYAEVEADARKCAELYPPPWDVADRGWMAQVKADAPDFRVVVEVDQDAAPGESWLGEYLDHIARHDPARVLRQVAAMRRVVDAHQGWEKVLKWSHQPTRLQDAERFLEVSTPIVRALTAIWADHPDYREEWAL